MIVFKKMKAELAELLPQEAHDQINKKMAMDTLEILGYFFKLPDQSCNEL
jgi:hypothetical protein